MPSRRRDLIPALLVIVLAVPAIALAKDYTPQDFPRAPLRTEHSRQGGRLLETSFNYRVGPDLCVSQGAIGDGTFPRPRQVSAGESKRLRFRLNAERGPDASLRYWTEVDSDGYAQGDSVAVPIEVIGRKPNGDFILGATLDVKGERYLRLSAFWEGKGICEGQEFLLNHYALAASGG